MRLLTSRALTTVYLAARQDNCQAARQNDPRRGAEPQDAARSQAEREARDFSEETGYRPAINQGRHEPLPASRHDERRQDAVVRNEEHATDRRQAAPSPRAPGRRKN
jgi:hypothetical protein